MAQPKILIVDDFDDLGSGMRNAFVADGFEVTVTRDRASAAEALSCQQFSVIISDLDGEEEADKDINLPNRSEIKSFKICVPSVLQNGFNEDALADVIKATLSAKSENIDKNSSLSHRFERIEFEIPGSIKTMHSILDYLLSRVRKHGVIEDDANLFVALDEAFVNAVKHGNKFDLNKHIRVTAVVSPEEARFTIEDEGEGFDVNAIPDPLDPQNLFKTSGRGVLIMHNVMDEVTYNERGNRLEMVKRSELPAE